MEILGYLWLFFILASLQPAIKKKMLESSRQKLIKSIEKKHGSRVIVLIHRQETMSLLGFPVYKYIDIDDSEEVIRAIHLTDAKTPIDLILHTPGGLVLAATQIARAIKKHPAKVRAYIPHIAMSGGTLIALAADEIFMNDDAVLGPVDPQLDNCPAASIVDVLRVKPISEIADRTLILANMAAKAIDQVRDTIFALLVDRFGRERAKEAAELLAEGYWTHDYPLTIEELKAMGLAVRPEIPEDIYKLMRLYPQPVKRQPSVDYLPEKKHRPEKA